MIKHEKLLTQICKCKGSMNYVHESCLIKWLTTHSMSIQNHQKRCELCLQEYRITYEFDTVLNIIKKGINYAFADKKRLIRGLLYALYLWIFFKRFIHMIKSLLKFVHRILLSSYRDLTKLSLRNSQKILEVSKNRADQQVTNLLLPNLHQAPGASVPPKQVPKSESVLGSQLPPSMHGGSFNKFANSRAILIPPVRSKRAGMRKLLSISSMVTTFIGMIGFLYRLFIFNQMCILFYGETIRIKKYVYFLVTNSKKIKIN